MTRELFIKLMERFLADLPVGRYEELRKRAGREFDLVTVFVFQRSKFQIRVVQLPKNSVGRTSHLALHRQQLLFFFAKRERFVSSQPLHHQLIQFHLRCGYKFFHLRVVNLHDLRTNVATCLARFGGDTL